MKLSSKSILSPSRTTRDPPQISLSSSLSRRLKTNGSMKGGQASPMFPTVGKRRGCGFENPEPSSPKVTCIGQVRVKTKKQGKKMRARSKRRGEASFRKTTAEHSQGFHQVGGANPDLSRQNSQSFHLQQECLKHRNQRWVHLPLTICEALREFSCFFPCRSSCMSREKEKGVELGGAGGSGGGDGREGSCGAAFQRWLVALQEGDGKGRGIELVMEEENENDDERGKGERGCSQRRHVFEDIDIDLVEGKKEELEEEEEKGRVSICIPPKNALLLMRCRSDPVKMAALANRFWESPVHNKEKCQEQKELDEDEEEDSGDEEEMQKEKEEEEEEEGGGNEDQHIEVKQDEDEGQEEKEVDRETKDDSICERETETNEEDDNVITFHEEEEAELGVKENCEVESNEFHEAKEEEEKHEEKEEENGNATAKGETFSCVTHSDLEKPETQEEVHLQEGEEAKENDLSSELSPSPETFTASEPENDETKAKAEEEEAVKGEASSEEGSTEEEEEKVTTESEQTEPTHDPDPKSKERENGSNKEQRERETLPECLLLMMCEPKLSMEVSKETWVCSTDFIRWLPERPAGKTAAAGGGGGKRVGVDSSKPKVKPSAPAPQTLMQPPRSSCSFPVAAGASMATMIEQKLVGSKSNHGYEPFVLTRCKSEPMRSSAKLAPEACFWNNRKLEPHPPPAQLGVGAQAGVGF